MKHPERGEGEIAEQRTDVALAGDDDGREAALTAALPPTIEVHTQVGSLLAHRDDAVITANLVRWGVWEAAETRFIRALVRPGDTFVDVGANVGYFSVLAASCVGPSGYVIAIEPEPRNLQLLHLNLARNGARSNATVLPVAAYSRAGRMVLTTNETNRGDHRLAPYASTGLEVRCVRLDDVLPRSVDAIKVDTQGFDHDVIAGLSKTIAANPALVVLTELSLTKLEKRRLNVDEVLAGYLERGFGIEVLDQSGAPFPLAAPDVVRRCAALGRDEISLVLRRADIQLGHENRPFMPRHPPAVISPSPERSQLARRLAKRILPPRTRRAMIATYERLRFRRPGIEQTFERTYAARVWGSGGDFYSGERFEEELTPYVELVRRFIADHGIDTVVDLGCGDFQVGARLADAAADYVGVDVVSSLIERNRSRFGRPGVRFEHLNLIDDDLPIGDLALLRQVLQHLSNSEIAAVLENAGQYPYLVVTEHLPPGDDIVPNLDKRHGPDVRIPQRSGVFLEHPPFSRPTRTLLEVRCAPDQLLRTSLLVSGAASQ